MFSHLKSIVIPCILCILAFSGHLISYAINSTFTKFTRSIFCWQCGKCVHSHFCLLLRSKLKVMLHWAAFYWYVLPLTHIDEAGGRILDTPLSLMQLSSYNTTFLYFNLTDTHHLFHYLYICDKVSKNWMLWASWKLNLR